MYADTDDRDVTSGDLWLAGFAPECNLTSTSGDFMHELINEGHQEDLYPGCSYASEAVGVNINDCTCPTLATLPFACEILKPFLSK